MGDEPEYFKKRAEVCKGCIHAVDSKLFAIIKDKMMAVPGLKCDACGCGLQQKLLVKDEKCPEGKWL